MRVGRSLLLLVSLGFPFVAFAQSTGASLTGFVDDPSKAIIPNVSITAINTQTGVKTNTVTNSDGVYVLGGLIPGMYRAEVDKQGFPWIYNGTNKTFFFVSYEGLRLAQPQAASVLYVPDTALRSSAAAAVQPLLNAFPVQTGSEALVPCTAGATSTYPCPAGSPAGTPVQSGLAEFSESYSLPATIDSTSVRLDHTFGPKLAVFFRFGGTPSFTSGRSLAVVNQTKVNAYTYTLGATSQFSTRITNELRLGYASTDAILANTLDDFGGAVPVNALAAVGLGAYNNPGFDFDLDFSGVGNTFLAVEPSSTGARTWNVTDHVNVLHGRHRITAGVDFIRYKSLQNSFSPLGDAQYLAPQGLLSNQATATSLQQVRDDLTRAQQERQGAVSRVANLENEVNSLHAAKIITDRAASGDEQFLAPDRDIRELMGARQLYIADVFDVRNDGQKSKPAD